MATYNKSQFLDRLNHVVLTNAEMLIRNRAYDKNDNFREFGVKIQKDIKFLSELLICLHSSKPDHPLTGPLLKTLSKILFHRYMLQAIRLNPLLANWLLNAVALLQDHYILTRERDFVLKLVELYGLDVTDAPFYRLEENRFLFAKLQGERHTPTISKTFERNFYRLSRDQIYALTHLLFYVSDYGTTRYSCSPERGFALENLIYQCFLEDDVDVLLELLLVYQACEQRKEKLVSLFEKLVIKRIKESSELHDAMTKINSVHFHKYYHQSLLAVMYCSVRADKECHVAKMDFSTYRELQAVHNFHQTLRRANYVKAAQKFTRLVGLDSSKLKLCRNNLDHYLAMQRYHLETSPD